MKILISGITGFAGSHLADYCLSQGDEVHGTIRWRSKRENILHLEDKIKLHECDLTDNSAVAKTLNEVKPDWIFHLAAQSYVKSSWSEPSHTLTNNILSELNIFENVRLMNLKPRIMVAGSSEEYGEVFTFPVTEETELRPISPYAVSKVAQDLLGFQYFKSYGMDIVRTRAFNHTGPRRGEVFVCSNFAKQIIDIEKGKEPVIHVGNLEARRDFTDVRDVVRGYYLALEKGKSGEVYNICSGSKGTHSIKQVLDSLLYKTRKKINLIVDQERMRPSDVPILMGKYSKFKKETNWEPQIPFKQTLDDLLNYWRNK